MDYTLQDVIYLIETLKDQEDEVKIQINLEKAKNSNSDVLSKYEKQEAKLSADLKLYNGIKEKLEDEEFPNCLKRHADIGEDVLEEDSPANKICRNLMAKRMLDPKYYRAVKMKCLSKHRDKPILQASGICKEPIKLDISLNFVRCIIRHKDKISTRLELEKICRAKTPEADKKSYLRHDLAKCLVKHTNTTKFAKKVVGLCIDKIKEKVVLEFAECINLKKNEFVGEIRSMCRKTVKDNHYVSINFAKCLVKEITIHNKQSLEEIETESENLEEVQQIIDNETEILKNIQKVQQIRDKETEILKNIQRECAIKTKETEFLQLIQCFTLYKNQPLEEIKKICEEEITSNVAHLNISTDLIQCFVEQGYAGKPNEEILKICGELHSQQDSL